MGAKKTKKTAVKSTKKATGKPGRPRLYSTPEKLQKEIDKNNTCWMMENTFNIQIKHSDTATKVILKAGEYIIKV